MTDALQRLGTIVGALIGGDATQQQIAAVSDAYVFKASDDEVMAAIGIPKSRLTDAQKAQVAIDILRRDVKSAVRYRAEQEAYASVVWQVKQAGDSAEKGL